MQYINRELERKFLKINSFSKAVLLIGARQVGKSTMLKKLAENTNRTFVTMDDDNNRQLAKTDPKLFFQTYKPPILIDEIQKAPELLEQIKIMCDESDERGRFWLTGSQRKKLMQQASDTLAGRLGILHLYPLSQREKENVLNPNILNFSMSSLKERYDLLGNNDIDKVFTHIWKGGYADVQNASSEEVDVYYQSYLDNYVVSDAVNDEGITNIEGFKRFIRACAALIGELVNYKTLAEAADINEKTAKNWLGILQGMEIIYLLEPYYNNELKRMVKSPKLYFMDTGLAAYLTRWTTKDSLQNGAANGHFFENYVVSELVKNFAYSAQSVNLNYFRNNKAEEIDIVIEENGKLHIAEIKLSANPNIKALKTYKIYEKTNLEKGAGGIICMYEKPFPIDNYYSFIPCNLI